MVKVQCTVHTSQGRKCCNVKLHKRGDPKKGKITDAEDYAIQQGSCWIILDLRACLKMPLALRDFKDIFGKLKTANVSSIK